MAGPEEKQMFLKRVSVTKSKHASMLDWKANVRSMPLPNFPHEESSFMSIACATTQRVDIRALCAIMTAAAKEAGAAYIDSRKLLTHTQGQATTHRQFPDRCFLTRRQQMQRCAYWSTSRKRKEESANHVLEYNWGFEEQFRANQKVHRRCTQTLGPN